jgi:hypothetical protein
LGTLAATAALLPQMMDESGPEHLAKTMGPEQTARLLLDTLNLGKG